MSLSQEEVLKIAHLARLSTDEKTLPKYANELSKILDLVAQMSEVNTANIIPMAHPLHASQPLRPDVITEHDQHLAFQAIAPAVEANLYLVPKVIE